MKKNSEGAQGKDGRVPVTGGILVNQSLRKVKLEGYDKFNFNEKGLPFGVSVKMENELNANGGIREEDEVGGLDETYVITKVVGNPSLRSSPTRSPPAKDSQDQGQRSSCCCQEEIETLKSTVNQLTLQMKKQSQVITGIKSCLRNFAISLTTCCTDDDGDENGESKGLQRISENEVATGSPAEDPQPNLINPSGVEVTPIHQMGATKIVDNTVNIGNHPFINYTNGGITKGALEMDDVDFQEEDKDKDSSYVPPPENEKELSQEKRNGDGHHGGARSSTTKSVKMKTGFDCWKCSKIFKAKEYLRKHLRRVHPDKGKESKNKCHYCTKVFYNISNLRQHFQSAHEGVRYKCAYCPGKFTNLKNVRRHEDTVHNKEEGPPTQQCKICGIHLLNTEKSLNTHMSKVHKKAEKKPSSLVQKEKRQAAPTQRAIIFQCQLCPSCFPERKELYSHQRRVHGIDSNVISSSEI